ncbi:MULTISPECIES: DNA polymerase IV [Bacillus cereus group]|uniref:DNA polymerase IV n=1 Tax=Bacillus thuringiensis TaxID=1428 RepID=A0A1C3ZZF5_BACTU|nr:MULTISPECIES: DNA polymerase IV [Bacillus cereus group]MED3024757.1 DNA polymerase IV [Bacillus wiedmannii]OTX97409.1 DNA polymerase IV [Bacillus thuringiensis serovar wratislaviensis]OUB62083.1 DNA polymerase IV [Bacillus thuringiensis serovar sylvestriensis]SCB87787.1 DNA polymerase IV [Bacillus thuringiensis]
MKMVRKIIHIDMDAFYSSIEQRDNPKLVGKPVVIARDPKQRGVVSTCSYEARKYGIYSSMSSHQAYKLCPHAIFIPPRIEYYKEVSKEIMNIFQRYTDIIEPIAFDEAFLDVTQNKFGTPSATIIAQHIQRTIYKEVGLTSSAGVSYNKFIAKLSSDFQKPCGLTVIPPEKADEFLESLPISKFFGVGKVTEKKMHSLDIFNGADLKKWSEEDLIKYFNKRGHKLFKNVRGEDNSPVKPHKKRKSIGKEHTFENNIANEDVILAKLKILSEQLEKSLQKLGIHGKTIMLKIRYSNFSTNTKRISIQSYIKESGCIYRYATGLWGELYVGNQHIRSIGIYLTGLAPISFNNLTIDEFL